MIRSKTIVIGVGNPLRRDDGIGSAVIQKLLSLKTENSKLKDVDLLDGGTDGLSLLNSIEEYSRAIIVDAVIMGVVPGTIKIFTPSEAIINVQFDALSTHGFGLAEMLKLAMQLQIETEIIVVGVQPLDIDFGHGLSEAISAMIPDLIKIILKLV